MISKRYVYTLLQVGNTCQKRTHSSPKCTASTNADATKTNNGSRRDQNNDIRSPVCRTHLTTNYNRGQKKKRKISDLAAGQRKPPLVMGQEIYTWQILHIDVTLTLFSI